MTQMNKEYASALFMLAKENGAEAEYEKALDTVLEVMKENPEYIDFLASPAVLLSERTQGIEEAFGEILPQHIVSFLCLMCEKGRIRELEASILEFKKMVEFSKNVSKAVVKSAVSLTEDEKQKLKEKLEKMSGHAVVLQCLVCDTLLGGIVIEMDGKIIDGSLKSRLREIKDVIAR